MALLPLWVTVEAASPEAWRAQPVATELHAVAWNYGARYQALVASGMGGRGASSVFGPVVAEADVHWRLIEATGEGLPMDAATAGKWRDTALAGSFIASERLFDESLGRSPELYALYLAADAFANPTMEIQRSGKGVDVGHRPGRAQSHLDREEIDAPPTRDSRGPNPTVRVGMDWTLRDEDAAPESDLLRWTAFLSLESVLLTRFRADFSLFDHTWVATARQRVYPQVYLSASLASAQPPEKDVGPASGVPDLGRVSTGILWSMPGAADWSLRLDRVVTLKDDSVTWTVTLRGEGHTRISARLDPPLGGYPGLPTVVVGRPNVVAPWGNPLKPTSRRAVPR